MGYMCPVCDAEQADAEHLANHLAITASLDRQGHREWLEEHAPEWGDCNPAELGEIVSQYAAEIETPDFDGGHDHGRPAGLEEGIAQQSRQPGRGSLTAEAEDVLREAQELTEQMQESGAEDGDGAERADGADGADEADGADGTENGTENENA